MKTHQKLIADFPELFQKLNHIDCGSGWNVLLEELFWILKSHIHFLPEELQSDLYLITVKEKLGALRVYFKESTPYMDGAIEMAQTISRKTCEMCGESGKMEQVRGMWQVRCSVHLGQKIQWPE